MSTAPLKTVTATLFLTADLAALSEAQMRSKLRECAACGIRTLIPTLAAEHGRSHFPSRVVPSLNQTTFSYTARRRQQPVIFKHTPGYDHFAAMLDEAAKLGMDMFLPTGTFSPEKPGSSMMWPFPATEWFTPQIAELNRQFIAEIAERYAASPAFAGWYLSDEMKWSIAEHELLVGAISRACRELTPGAIIMMSPSAAHAHERNRYLTDPAAVAKLNVDIICPMDCSGYTHRGSGPFTQQMWHDIEDSQERTAAACRAAGKQFWSNVELFWYDHAIEQNVPHAADWPRIQRQIQIASAHAQRLCCFQFFTIMDAPESEVPMGEANAQALYAALQQHNESHATIPLKSRA